MRRIGHRALMRGEIGKQGLTLENIGLKPDRERIYRATGPVNRAGVCCELFVVCALSLTFAIGIGIGVGIGVGIGIARDSNPPSSFCP